MVLLLFMHFPTAQHYSVTAERIYTFTNVDGGVGDTGLIEKQYINVSLGRVESITKFPSSKTVFDFRADYDILPRMINAHSHLELSQFETPLDVQFQDDKRKFDEWIRELVRFRHSSNYDPAQAVHKAASQFKRSQDTSAVVDIVPLDVELSGVDFGVGYVFDWLCYPELIGWNSSMAAARLLSFQKLPLGSYSGVSPHAPHTVSAELLEMIVGLGMPIAMHLGESPDEIMLIKNRKGRLLDLMRQADKDYEPEEVLLGNRIQDYLQLLSNAPKTLVIHGNYLDDNEIEFLAKHHETMAVVYTPRSHDYFGFDEYPLGKMLDKGVCVLLGTDSLASNYSLSMSDEIKYATKIHPNIPREILFKMATINAAKFLNITKNHGTIESGKPANITLY
ncbi:MAG: amidohydrolase family protein, partial [Planctomycetaceae bacterium]|nr:amidohydrolase family protein [Planctomycetaceae bacterium]